MEIFSVRWIFILAAFTSSSITFGDETIVFPGMKPDNEWWSNTIIYQVYPRSFKDSDNDGIGDLKGITQSLDHFVDLGVGAVWINPILKSPMDDLGYDVENYTVIDPIFGTMDDFDELISELNKRGLKLILELVPNHSSYKCEWFQKSINQQGKYKDYYVWRNASNQHQLSNSSVTPLPPNNWLCTFGQSAWTWNTERKQFYLHQFSDKQPDFNFRTPEVHMEFFKIMEFWMDRGVAGFRFNAVGKLYENANFTDEPHSVGRESWPKYYSLTHEYTNDVPENVETILEWRKFMDNYSKKKNTFPRLLVADVHYRACVYSLAPYFGNSNHPGAQIPLNYHLLTIPRKEEIVESIDFAIQFWFDVIPANNTPNWVMESIDTDRISSKYGPEAVQIFTALKLALPGVEVTYYGSEIGMENTYVRPKQIQDSKVTGDQKNAVSRDFARTPMQWNDMTNAGLFYDAIIMFVLCIFQGFTKAKKSWLPVNSNYYRLNVEAQKQQPNSNYNFYKKMSELRRTDTLKYGGVQLYNITDSVYIIKRFLSKRETYLVVVNFGSETETINLSNVMRNLNEKFYVYLGSANSAYSKGNVISTISAVDKLLKLRPKSAVVLTDNADMTKSAANGYGLKMGSTIISLLCAWLLYITYF
ncbi:Hypothetical protein CINCED_3A024361 [Cinara cedri]|uniref:alpha-glucosidase n=1 Tax=Cinara cedri TaxID=506608 RepID=A0A5E4MEY9_9HEMI|nr:Hypothetical protein CINCED_3A024361 [Cinara cedri]